MAKQLRRISLKVHQFGPSEIIHSRPEIVVVGSRVIVLDCEGGLDSMKLYFLILKLVPTLTQIYE